MLKIVSLGHAFPEFSITNELLSSFSDATPGEEVAGINQRASTLREKYLLEGKNKNPREAHRNASETPTDLGVRAARMAIERAGIDPQQIELVVAGTSTPLETCPGESQRIAGALELKKPAFDISASSVDFGVFLNAIGSWKKESTPGYTLCVSTNTPTQRLDYAAARGESYLLGDGAAAAIVTVDQPGRLKVVDTFIEMDTALSESFVFDAYDHAEIDLKSVYKWNESQQIKMLTKAAKANDIVPGKFILVGNQISLKNQQELARQFQLSDEQSLENVSTRGCSLGSAPISVLSENWDELNGEEPIIVLLGGAGLSSGYLVFQGGAAC